MSLLNRIGVLQDAWFKMEKTEEKKKSKEKGKSKAKSSNDKVSFKAIEQ